MRADLRPGALVGLSRGLGGLPEDPRVSGPGGHTTAAQVEAPLSQTDKTKTSKRRKNMNDYQKKGEDSFKKTGLDSSQSGRK